MEYLALYVPRGTLGSISRVSADYPVNNIAYFEASSDEKAQSKAWKEADHFEKRSELATIFEVTRQIDRGFPR